MVPEQCQRYRSFTAIIFGISSKPQELDVCAATWDRVREMASRNIERVQKHYATIRIRLTALVELYVLRYNWHDFQWAPLHDLL